jgi:hypothetical protein
VKNRPLNRSQRAVIVVGLGVALYMFGLWLTSLGSNLNYGWVAYAPLSDQTNITGLHPWVRHVIWILLIGVWVLVSVSLLKEKNPT